jgi:hypothetical protein
MKIIKEGSLHTQIISPMVETLTGSLAIWTPFWKAVGSVSLKSMVEGKHELEIMWKKYILSFLKFLSQSFPGKTEEKHE